MSNLDQKIISTIKRLLTSIDELERMKTTIYAPRSYININTIEKSLQHAHEALVSFLTNGYI